MEDKIIIGKIINTRGLKGELKVKVLQYDENKFNRDIKYFIKDDNNQYEAIEITKSIYMKKFFYIKLKGYEDINEVNGFINKYIYINEGDLEELEDDSYYVKDLIGLNTLDENGDILGIVEDVFTEYPNPVLGVNDLLIPMVKEYILEVNLKEGYIKINKESLV